MNSVLKVKKYIRKTTMLPDGAQVTVALSGGADSVALLRVMKKLGYRLDAVHVNHNLRGEEALRDERFSRRLCEGLGVPFKSVSVDVRAYAKSFGMSVETAARELRYKALEENGAKYIATAHTMSDNAETVLFNLIRGGSTEGLCGIPPIIEKDGSIFVRPLLCLTRDETEELAGDFVTDSTNNTDEATRNRIRHNIMPLIKKENPSAEQTIFENCALLRADAELLESLSDGVCPDGLTASGLAAAQKPLAARAVIRQLKRNGVPISGRNVEAVLSLAKNASPSAERDLQGVTVRRVYDDILFGKEAYPPLEPMALSLGKNSLSDGGLLTLSREKHKINNLLTILCVNENKIDGNLMVRPRQSGDSIRTESGTKTVKKSHIDNKIPRCMREHMPVICDGRGVVCAFGCGVDIEYKTDKNTENVICIAYEGNKNGK